MRNVPITGNMNSHASTMYTAAMSILMPRTLKPLLEIVNFKVT